MERLVIKSKAGSLYYNDAEHGVKLEPHEIEPHQRRLLLKRLYAYEDTGLTPEQIMELKESVQRLDKIFGAEITVDQVIDFFVDFYIAQGNPDRVEAAELLTNEEVARYRELKERDKSRKIEVNAGVPICPVCGRRIVKCYDFCPDCGQRLKQ